jgi:phospholipase C
VRFARALPYRLHVNCQVQTAQSQIAFTFANSGQQGAHFYLYLTNRTDGPWGYTVEAGKSLEETFSVAQTNGQYAFSVHGPNGFFRSMAGTLAQPNGAGESASSAQPEVKAFYDVANGNIFLVFENTGSVAVTLTVTDNAYGAAARSVNLPPTSALEGSWNLGASHHWYDLSVTSSSDPTFLRRLAGHVEVGRTSISDPAAVAPVSAF